MRLSINSVPQMTEWPISAPFGSVDDAHKIAHQGVDFAVGMNTPVPSFSSGTVTSITDEGARSFGRAVHVTTPNGDEVIYGHLSRFKCQVGEHVNAGDVIGLSGTTGDSTGPHLHIQVMHNGQAIDPLTYFHMSGDDGSTGIPLLDRWSEVWKQNAERIFHIPDAATNQPLSVTEQLQQAFFHLMQNLGRTLNENSAQIVTFAIIICAFGVMVAPLIGSHPSKWYGRMLGAFFGGVIWRIVISAS